MVMCTLDYTVYTVIYHLLCDMLYSSVGIRQIHQLLHIISTYEECEAVETPCYRQSMARDRICYTLHILTHAAPAILYDLFIFSCANRWGVTVTLHKDLLLRSAAGDWRRLCHAALDLNCDRLVFATQNCRLPR